MTVSRTAKFFGNWPAALSTVLMAWAVLFAIMQPAAAQLEGQIEGWKKEVSETDEKLLKPDLTKTEIETLRNRLEEIRASALQGIETIKPELQNYMSRAEQLKPVEGVKDEPPEVTKERENVDAQVVKLKGLLQQLEVVSLVASQVSGKAAELQRKQFLQRIFEPGRPVLDPRFWIDGLKQTSALYDTLSFITKNWFRSTAETQTPLGWLARVGILFVIWLVCWPLRHRLQRLIGPNLKSPSPSRLEVLWRAAYLPMINGLVVALAFGAVIVLAHRLTEGMSLRFGQLAELALGAALLFVVLSSLSRGVLAPGAPPWRLPHTNDVLAIKLNRLLTLLAAVFTLDRYMADMSTTLNLPVEFTVMQSGVSSVAMTAILIWMLLVAHPRQADADAVTPAAGGAADAPGPFNWVVRLRWALWLLAGVNAMALALGYIALASFLCGQMVITASLFVAAYVLHLLFDEALTAGLARGLVLGDFVRRTFSLSERGVTRLGLILTTLADVLLLLIVAPLIVLQWTVTWIDLKSLLTVTFFGFKVGDFTISPFAIVIALGVFTFVFVLTRLVVRWLDIRILRRTKIDRGIRDSISTTANYAGFLLAALLAATYAGLDFTNLAIVAGALSLGVGFGLQSIVNNFVSGLILLAERPIRVGDWIVVGPEEGTVRKINVRATEIETFDRTTVIIPNSTLISESVKNWTHRDRIARLKIPVGVSYASDPKKVEALLLDMAANEPLVLRSPEPYVYFKDFGASSLDFELRCYIFDVDNIITVYSNLRYAIVERFREEGIEIPFPQRDINLRDMDRLAEALDAKSKSNSAPRRTRSKERE